MRGVFLAKTPNAAHYVSLIATCTPHWFHEMVNEWRGRKCDDTFPTYYRANRWGQVKRLARETEFSQPEFVMLEGRPEYLRITAATYLLGWLYERVVNNVPGAQRFAASMIVIMRTVDERATAEGSTNGVQTAAAA